MQIGLTFFIFAVVAIVVVAFLLFLVLFEPGLEYKITDPSLPLKELAAA